MSTQDPLLILPDQEAFDPTQNLIPTWMANDDGLRTISLHEMARVYHVGMSTLRRHMRQGRLKAIRVGRYKCVTLGNLREYLGAD